MKKVKYFLTFKKGNHSSPGQVSAKKRPIKRSSPADEAMDRVCPSTTGHAIRNGGQRQSPISGGESPMVLNLPDDEALAKVSVESSPTRQTCSWRCHCKSSPSSGAGNGNSPVKD